MNVRQYNRVNRVVKWMSDNITVNRAVKWISDITIGKQSSKMNVRIYNEVYRAVKWMLNNTMGKTEQ